MIATTESPTLRPRRSTELFEIIATTSWPPTSTTTSPITAPGVTCLIVPLSWLRALICIWDSSLLARPLAQRSERRDGELHRATGEDPEHDRPDERHRDAG